MKPPAFQYIRPKSLQEALSILNREEDAKILAGGQSLIPMMNMRLARPGILIDINGLDELSAIQEQGDALTVGALVRHYQLQESDILHRWAPLVRQAEHLIGHEAIRSRGTIGGSLSHADPAAELPVIAVLEDWDLVVSSEDETHIVPAREFFLSYFITAVAPNEMVTAVRMAKQNHPGHITEYAIRSGDFALAIAAVTLDASPSGELKALRVALGGVGDVPWRSPEFEEQWLGERIDADLWRRIAKAAAGEIEPSDDLHASADYRRYLAENLLVQSLERAVQDSANVQGRA